MDLENLQSALLTFPIFPYLWIPHCLLMSFILRLNYGPSALNHAKTNPLSCYLRCLLYTYPGYIVSSLLLAQPPFAFLGLLQMFISQVLNAPVKKLKSNQVRELKNIDMKIMIRIEICQKL